MRSLIHYSILVLTLSACSEKPKKSNTVAFDFNDTIRRTEVERFSDLDSLVEHQIITFTPNDLTVPIDSFYYNALERRYDKGESYRLYFDKQKVIAYCDSMLKVLDSKKFDDFEDSHMYKSILENAQQGFAETISIEETHYLMNRFKPLIINPETGHKPDFYFTTHRISSEREDIEREFVTQKGDTFGLSWKNIWLADLRIDTMR